LHVHDTASGDPAGDCALASQAMHVAEVVALRAVE